jgi:16S rRNA (cytosine1402-N4)-methyltransferase
MNVVNVVPMKSQPPIDHSASAPHTSVLQREVAELFALRQNGTLVDATLGAGGHTGALLAAGCGVVVGIDRDPRALEIARARLERFGERVVLRHGCFSQIGDVLAALGIERVDGILADLGVSSMQLDEPERGMSFRFEGPLDMRMDPTRGESARELIMRLDDDDLAEVIARLGEERRARRVAKCIKQEAAIGKLDTTLDLRRAVVRAVGPARVGGIDPATRTFQALRMAVNRELFELEALLDGAPRWLRSGGILAVISFHSLEDRMTKRAFQQPPWQPLAKKPVVPSAEETLANPRAKSAKLRAARSLEAGR